MDGLWYYINSFDKFMHISRGYFYVTFTDCDFCDNNRFGRGAYCCS